MQRGPKEEVEGKVGEEIAFLIAVACNADNVGATDDGRGIDVVVFVLDLRVARFLR